MLIGQERFSSQNSETTGPRHLVVLIPAYRPGPALVRLVQSLDPNGWLAVVVIDDGSGPEFRPVFEELARLPNVEVVPHAVNLGKGSALKTGINAILCRYPDAPGVVTVDADGQHDPEDVFRVCESFQGSPEALVLGVRTFEGKVPLRSRMGNALTRGVMRALVGQNLSDTQTGLRAIPRPLLIRMLKVAAPGYEFELEMLLVVKHLGLRVVEQPIRTIYEPDNPSSHFQPLRDSMRIYFVLLRFAGIGLLTAGLDNLIFLIAFNAAASILVAQIIARIGAIAFNYSTVRGAVFHSGEPHRLVLPRYLLVALANAALSYVSIRFLNDSLAMPVLPAKLTVETLLFSVNFIVQRDFVFTKRMPSS